METMMNEAEKLEIDCKSLMENIIKLAEKMETINYQEMAITLAMKEAIREMRRTLERLEK